jgi:hypothetical protein
MPTGQALITLARDEIAPRFDMTAEAVIVPLGYARDDAGGDAPLEPAERRHLVLARVSSDELCDVIARAGISLVVCGGIGEDHYHYLRWKRVAVICDVIGKLEPVLERLAAGTLQDGDHLCGGLDHA